MSFHRVKITEAQYPEPFRSGLEYNPPARGVWNIVHTGMLIPEARQIFVCARGCLRGVILTAAEMNAMDRMSWVAVEEEDMFDGSMEDNVVEGVTAILEGIDKLPPAVLIFLSCIHLFTGCDFEVILARLRERFPQVEFTDCYMTPTMRKSISPDAKMRMQLYSFLKPVKKNERSMNIIGCDRPTDEDSELMKILRSNGFTVRDITLCNTYEEYKKMSESVMNITYLPTAVPSGERLESRLGARHLYIPLCYGFDEIRENYAKLCRELNICVPDFSEETASAEKALKDTLKVVGSCPVAVDFTALPRPFGFARLLCEHGFSVKYIFADVISAEDRPDFEKLKEISPETEIVSAVNSGMLFGDSEFSDEKILAVGQKAAYYCGTDNFVNIVSGGGYYGFSGIEKLCDLMTDAFLTPKNRRETIRLKGLGCESCLK